MSQACHSTPQIEMIIIFILINELTDTGIILLIFNQELFHLKFTKYYLTRSTCYLLSAVVLIKFISLSCLLLGVGYLSPSWMTFIRIILSNDVETNPGDFVNNFFTFCNWNLNSLAKDDFYRVKLLEAHNSIHNYDFISICETSLNDTVYLPDEMLENYTFMSCNSPSNTRRGGVGLFYKNDLPVKIRTDLSFEESIVIEVVFGRKNVFLTVIYKSPSYCHGTPEFELFLNNIEALYENIKKDNPFAVFFAGDFNGHSQLWWNDGDTNAEGKEIEQLTSQMGLNQLLEVPTHFEPNKNPSCIDLIFTDQPNCVIESGTRPSLGNYCHHQIIYCRMNFQIPPTPSYESKIWHFGRANIPLIRRSITNFPWSEVLNGNSDTNWQAKTFTEIILNIMTNFIPNETIIVKPRNPPWITKPIKTMLNKQSRLFQNFKKHGYRADDKSRLDIFRQECKKAIDNSREMYLKQMGLNLADPNTDKIAYWKIMNKVMNKYKAPKIPPILSHNKFIINCKQKANVFANFFSLQCKPMINECFTKFYTSNHLEA